MFKKKLTRMLALILSASCLLTTTSALNVSADEEENTNANTHNYYVGVSKTNDTIKLENISLEVSKA